MEKFTENENVSYTLPASTNQALLLAKYGREFLEKGNPSKEVFQINLHLGP